jgi:hypothetical protein
MSRQGLKRLECADQCGALAYMTLAQLERHGCPCCPCGAAMVPEALEVACAVLTPEQLDLHPSWRDFWGRQRSIQHGQASHIQRGRQVRAPEAIAAERIDRDLTRAARERRLSGLKQYANAASAVEEIPF